MKQTINALIESAKIQAVSNTANLRFGPVTDATATAVVVTIENEDVGPVPLMKGVTAAPGDQAWLLQQGSVLVCIGVSS